MATTTTEARATRTTDTGSTAAPAGGAPHGWVPRPDGGWRRVPALRWTYQAAGVR